MIDFLDVLLTVFSLVILALPGFIMAKLKMFREESAKTLSDVVLYCCQTALLFMCFQKVYDKDIALNMVWVFLITMAVHFVMIFICCVLVRGNDELKLKCVRYGSIFGNCGYIGIPILKMLFEGNANVDCDRILIYTAVVLAVWNLLNWTVGVYIVSGDKKEVSLKKVALNPVLIAIVLGFLSFIIFKKPIAELGEEGTVLRSFLQKIMTSINYFGDAVTPISMFVVGMKLANVNFKQLFMDKLAYLQVFLKLIVMSVVSMLIVAFLPVDVGIKYAVFFTMSMPAATSTALFAVKFKGNGDFGSVCVLLSTTLSVITIPLMFLIFTNVFGVII